MVLGSLTGVSFTHRLQHAQNIQCLVAFLTAMTCPKCYGVIGLAFSRIKGKHKMSPGCARLPQAQIT